MRWTDRALCLGTDIDWWFPPGGNGHHRAVARARAICRECPVTTACLEAALRQEGTASAATRFGIRGGLGPRQRYDIAAARDPHLAPRRPRPRGRARPKGRKQPTPRNRDNN